MRDELESLINEKLNTIDSSLEDMYTPYDEEIKEEIENQNKKATDLLLNQISTNPEKRQEEKAKDVE